MTGSAPCPHNSFTTDGLDVGTPPAAALPTLPTLSHSTLVHRRAGVGFHPLPQRLDQLLVDHELAIVVRDLIRCQRPQALRRRHVGARGERADAALLLFRQEPGEIE